MPTAKRGYDFMLCKIEFTWDEEAEVWIATSSDVPGLVLESGSFDALVERVKQAVPELFSMNGIKVPVYRLSFSAEREDVVQMNRKRLRI